MNQESTVCMEGGTGSLKLLYSSKQNSSNSSKHRQNSRASGWWEVSQDPWVTSMEIIFIFKIKPAASAAQHPLLPLLNYCLEPPEPPSAASSTYWESLTTPTFPSFKLIWNHIYIFQKLQYEPDTVIILKAVLLMSNYSTSVFMFPQKLA